ncbi:chorismate-binding protein [Candidatus Woesearchaeota archaeon]|nr:chorismate-binding protein [Candidatus Woesearchaeota archaeon]
MLESVKEAKIGTIVPLHKELEQDINFIDYFANLSNFGKKKNSLLLEHENEIIFSTNPCLKLTGKGNEFEILALNETGKKFLNHIKKSFTFCDKAVFKKDKIRGILNRQIKKTDELQRLKAKTHLDIIDVVATSFKPSTKSAHAGLYGMISYDFIDELQDSSVEKEDPDYVLYFLDNMMVVQEDKAYIVANCLITDNKKEQAFKDCEKIIKDYEKVFPKKLPKKPKLKKKEFVSEDVTSETEFSSMLKSLRANLVNGDILYASPARLSYCTFNAEPLDVYAEIKNNHPRFFMNISEEILIGSGTGTMLSVLEEDVELKAVTATKPASSGNGDKDLENKYEVMLRTDENQIGKHIIMIDSARSDIARICSGRYVDKMFNIEKNGSVQTLSFSVKGKLKKGMKWMHPYISTINFSAGMPRYKAASLLRNLEKNKRGFYSGSLVHIGLEGNLNSFVADTIKLKKDKAFVMKSANVFQKSNDDVQVDQSSVKVENVLESIESSGAKK